MNIYLAIIIVALEIFNTTLYGQDNRSIYFLFSHGSIDVPQEAAAYAESNSGEPYIITGLYKTMSFDPKPFAQWGNAQDVKQLEQEYKRLEGTLSPDQSIVGIAKGRGALTLLNVLNAQSLPRLKAAVIESPEGNLANLDLYGIPEDLPILLVAYPDTAQNKENITKLYQQLKWLGLTDVYAITPKNSQEHTQAAHAFYGFYGIPHDAALVQEGVQQLLKELPLSVEQKGQNWDEWIPLASALTGTVGLTALPSALKKIYKTYKRWAGTGSGDGRPPRIPKDIAETQKAYTAAGTSEGVGLMPGNPAEINVEPVSLGAGAFPQEQIEELQLTSEQKAIQTLVQNLKPKLLKVMEIQQQLVGQLPSLLNKSSADI
ncbi:MAG TPA: hypothetical protein VHA52_11820, partial [Candidatus Babeliaceae bacterium]|nr:hypothetical protein [Candidatus Babeliaceae bacterium]